MSILRTVFASSAVLLALELSACSSGSDTGTGGAGATSGSGGAGSGGGFMTAAHPALPQVVNFGGSVIEAPRVQAIVYASDPHAADIDGFLAELSSSAYWAQTTAEYGVGALTILPTILRPEAAPAMLEDTDLTAALLANTAGPSPAWGAADGQTIYLFVMPEGSIVEAGGACCLGYDGFHDETKVGSVKVAYGVVCSCPGLDGPGVDDVQQVTVAMSHEIIEAATDPFPFTSPAYAQTDDSSIIWTLLLGGEVADMCQFDVDSFVIPAGSKYMVQKSWSNAAAKAGTDPCVPATPGAPFFAAAPVLPDLLKIVGVPFKTSGVKLAKGQSKTIDVQLFSDLPTKGEFQVTAHDFNEYLGGTPNLTLTLDRPSGQNGDVLKLTITMNAIDGKLGVDAFILQSALDGEYSLALGAVGPN